MATIELLLCHSLVRSAILIGKSPTGLQVFTIHYSTKQRSFVPQDDKARLFTVSVTLIIEVLLRLTILVLVMLTQEASDYSIKGKLHLVMTLP